MERVSPPGRLPAGTGEWEKGDPMKNKSSEGAGAVCTVLLGPRDWITGDCGESPASILGERGHGFLISFLLTFPLERL